MSTLAQRLHERGERLTGPRRVVMHALMRAPGHHGLEEIVELVHDIDPTVHRASVHRSLDMLCELGLVQHVHLGHGATAYHLVSDEGHAHAQCRVCGAVIDLPAELFTSLQAAVASSSGFQLDARHVALSGTCQDCAAASDDAPAQHASDEGAGAPAPR